MFSGLMSRWTIPILCGRFQRPGRLDGHVEDILDAHLPARDALAQGLALYDLCGYEARAVFVADLVDRDDVRVIERGGGAGFLLEAEQALVVFRELARQHLQSHPPPEPRVLRQIDITHAARANLLENSVMGYGLGDHANLAPRASGSL